MKRTLFSAWAAVPVVALVACKSPPAGSSGATASSVPSSATMPPPPARGSAARGVRIVEAPAAGTVESVVSAAVDGARASRETLVVYVGATWCEPCQRFHQAAARGELDALLPKVELLTFDLDRDRERLAAAGYVSKYIPLLALPGPNGAASGKQIEGGVKGDGAVGFIVPRLQAMLSE